MNGFIVAFFWGACAFAALFAAGLGPAVLLLPRTRRRDSFTLAPALGMCLLGLIGLFQLTVLLTPLTPRLNWGGLALTGAAACVVRRRELADAWRRARKQVVWLLVPGVGMLLAFATVFHKDGVHLLIGSSDQMQYSQNARHILEEMHTGSALDMPVARQEYYLYDGNTRLLPYLKSYRRGAEVLLATTSGLTGLTPEEAFSVTMTAVFLTLGTALGFVGRLAFRMSLAQCVVLEAVVFNSFYLLMVHVQGSLALACSLPLTFVSLALLVRTARSPSLRWTLTAAIFVAGMFSFYAEPVPLTLLVPAGLLAVRQLLFGLRRGAGTALRLAAAFCLAAVVAPYGAHSVYANAQGNLIVVRDRLNGLSHTAAAAPENKPGLRQVANSYVWAPISVALGGTSYYAQNWSNSMRAQWLAERNWVGFGLLGLACGLGALGYLTSRRRLGRLLAVIPLGWFAVCCLLAPTFDVLRVVRSAQYAIPLALVGVVLLACRRATGDSAAVRCASHAAAWSARIAVAVFLWYNVQTVFHTVKYLTQRDSFTDPIVFRLSDRLPPWTDLRREFAEPSDAPLLYSGFQDTVRPLMIACALRNQPHVVGPSILKFWPIYNLPELDAQRPGWKEFNVRRSPEEYAVALNRQPRSFDHVIPQMIERSQRAIVPVGHGYPIEWSAYADVYSPRIKRFRNCCDVVEKTERSVGLPSKMVASLEHDSTGLYRTLRASGRLEVSDDGEPVHRLRIEYEGDIGDVRVRIGDRLHAATAAGPGPRVEINLVVREQAAPPPELIVACPVKLRALAWTPETEK